MTRKILSNLISMAQGAYQKSFMTHGFNFLRCTNTIQLIDTIFCPFGLQG